ncbi:MAG: DUF5005 domain-containing protein [Desulfobacterales bacterium]
MTALIRRNDSLKAILLTCLLVGLSLGFHSCRWPVRSSHPPAPAVVSDTRFNALFSSQGPGWTGGDAAQSVSLPDGSTLWLFGDSFLGRVRPNGSRSPLSPMVRNCLVLQKGDHLTTLHGGQVDAPSAFFSAESPSQWYWPGDGVIENHRVRVFLHRFSQQSPGMWGWKWEGTGIASLAYPSLDLEAIDPLEWDNGVLYGVALLETRHYTYVYGTKDNGEEPVAHVARAPRGDLGGSWSFWDGSGWSSHPASSRGIVNGVSVQYGVAAWRNGGFALITMDRRQPFSPDLVLYLSPEPQGAWSGPFPLYRAPEAEGDVAAYNPSVHPQFTVAGRLLVSYNLNHVSNPDALYLDATIYRPRFLRVEVPQ